MHRVTIRQVAAECGVSISTVSNVLNGRTTEMSKDTLERVRKAVADLGYRPSSVARGLVIRRTATIGIVLGEIETSLFLGAISAVESIARAAGYSLIVCHARGPEDEREAVALLQAKDVEGVIFVSTSEKSDDTHLSTIAANGTTVVVINRPRPNPRIGCVVWDDCEAVTRAVRYLSGLGHRRIAHLCGPDNRHSAMERLRGYRLGLDDCGLPAPEGYVQGVQYNAEPGTWARSTEKILTNDPAPTAIIAADDLVAAVAMRTAQRHGLRVPQDLAVIGIDDQMFAPLLNPALTTIRLPIREAAEQAMAMLLASLDGEVHVPEEEVRLRADLVIRESCGGRSQDLSG
jgi:LacI family transcriptional regulator